MAQNMKSICRAALLNDNAPDSKLYQTEFEPQRGAAIFAHYTCLIIVEFFEQLLLIDYRFNANILLRFQNFLVEHGCCLLVMDLTEILHPDLCCRLCYCNTFKVLVQFCRYSLNSIENFKIFIAICNAMLQNKVRLILRYTRAVARLLVVRGQGGVIENILLLKIVLYNN